MSAATSSHMRLRKRRRPPMSLRRQPGPTLALVSRRICSPRCRRRRARRISLRLLLNKLLLRQTTRRRPSQPQADNLHMRARPRHPPSPLRLPRRSFGAGASRAMGQLGGVGSARASTPRVQGPRAALSAAAKRSASVRGVLTWAARGDGSNTSTSSARSPDGKAAVRPPNPTSTKSPVEEEAEDICSTKTSRVGVTTPRSRVWYKSGPAT